jgi:hypothetical protein
MKGPDLHEVRVLFTNLKNLMNVLNTLFFGQASYDFDSLVCSCALFEWAGEVAGGKGEAGSLALALDNRGPSSSELGVVHALILRRGWRFHLR